MNKLIKLLAITVIAVFALVGCSPDLKESEYDWDVNRSNDPANVSATSDEFLPTVEYENSRLKEPRVTINFPRQADVLRIKNKDDIQGALEKFLSFHQFTQPLESGTTTPDPEFLSKGLTSELGDAIPYTYIKMIGTSITVQLDWDFTITPPATVPDVYSDLVAKFDGKEFTHSKGNQTKGIMMDVDKDGVPGQDGFDDLYLGLALSNSNLSADDFVRPGHRDWTVTLATGTPTFTFTGDSEEATRTADFTIATIDLEDITTGQNNDTAFTEIGAQVASGFKLQKLNGDPKDFKNSSWTDIGTGAYDHAVNGATSIVIKGPINVKHGDILRVYWSGSSNIKSANKYFGVNQRIQILGGQNEPETLREILARTIAVSDLSMVFNNSIYTEISDTSIHGQPLMEVLTVSAGRRNAVLKFTYRLLDHTPTAATRNYVGLVKKETKEFQDDKEKVAIFKIIRPLVGKTASDINLDDTSYRTIKISDVKFDRDGYNFKDEDGDYKNAKDNVIIIEIDSDAELKDADFASLRLLINDGFAYDCEEPYRKFGDRTNFMNNNYRMYTPTVRQEGVNDTWWYKDPEATPTEDNDVTITPAQIANGDWVVSSLSYKSQGRNFKFEVSAGERYEIYIDASNGSGLYNKAVTVSASGAFTLGAINPTNPTNTPGTTAVIQTTNPGGQVTLTVVTQNAGTPAGNAGGSFAIRVFKTAVRAYQNNNTDTVETIEANGQWKEFVLNERSSGMYIQFPTESGNFYIVEWNDLNGDAKYTKDIQVGITGGGAGTTGLTGLNEGFYYPRQFEGNGAITTLNVQPRGNQLEQDKAGKFAVRVTMKEPLDPTRTEYTIPPNGLGAEQSLRLEQYYKGHNIEFPVIAGDEYEIRLFHVSNTSGKYTSNIYSPVSISYVNTDNSTTSIGSYNLNNNQYVFTAGSQSSTVRIAVTPQVTTGIYGYGTFGVQITRKHEEKWNTPVTLDYDNDVASGRWLSAELTPSSLGQQYSFTATNNTDYRIEWVDDGDTSGGTTYSKDVVVSVTGAGATLDGVDVYNGNKYFEFRANAGTTVTVTVQPKAMNTAAGSFRIRICEKAWKTAAPTNISVTDVTNNNWQTAVELGAFSLGQQYIFSATSGTEYTIQWQGVTLLARAVKVSATGAGASANGNTTGSYKFTATSTDQVTIIVEPQTVGDPAGRFQLRVGEKGWKPDVTIPADDVINNTPQAQVELGATSLGQRYFLNPTSGNYYKIVWQGGNVKVSVTGDGFSETNNTSGSYEFTAASGTQVRIEVEPQDLDADAGSFTLRVGTYKTSTTINPDIGWNDDSIVETGLGAEYKFATINGNKYLIAFNGSAGSSTNYLNADVVVLGNNGISITNENGWNGTINGNSFVADGSTYTMRVISNAVSASSTAVKQYQIRVTDITNANIIALDTAVDGNFTTASEEISYYMNVTANTTYKFKSDGTATVKGISFNGSYFTGALPSVVFSGISFDDTNEGTFTPTSSGIVFINFRATNNTETGDFKFTVTDQ